VLVARRPRAAPSQPATDGFAIALEESVEYNRAVECSPGRPSRRRKKTGQPTRAAEMEMASAVCGAVDISTPRAIPF
jgi:hypothetical protein